MIYHLTDSALYIGYVALAMSAPWILLTPLGGVVADKFDKRLLLTASQIIFGCISLLLATLTLLDLIQAWHVIGLAAAGGVVVAFEVPSHEALYPNFIGREAMTSAVALDAAMWQGSAIVAPAVAGGVIALAGIPASFYLASAGFFIFAAAVFRLRRIPMTRFGGHGGTWRNMIDGFKFIARNTVFSLLIVMTFFNSFFGLTYLGIL